MGDNVNRKQLSQRAGNVGYDPQNLSIQNLGNVSFSGGVPRAQLTPEQRAQSGMFGNIFNQSGGSFQNLAPGQAQYGAGAFGASNDLFARAAAMDPLEQAEQRFGRLRETLDPRRDEQRKQQEARLFAQGRLDSTAGVGREAAQEAAFAGEDAQLMEQLVQSGEAQRRGLFQDAITAGQAGNQVQSGLFSQMGGTVAGQQQLSAPLMKLLGMSSNLATADTAGQVAGVNAIKGANTSNAATDNGPSMFQSLLKTGATGLATTFGGPLAGMATNSFMGAFGGGGGTSAQYGTVPGSEQTSMLAEQDNWF